MGTSFPSLPSGGSSPQLFALDSIPGLPEGVSLEDLLNPAKFAEARDTFVTKNQASEDKLHAETQKTLSPQRFSFFKNAKDAFDKGYLTTSEKKDDNIKVLTNAAEGDDVFARQTIQKMQVHDELTSSLKGKREALDTKNSSAIKQFAKLLKPKA